MRVLIFVEDLYSTTGGGQSFFCDTIRAHPDYEFWYFTSAAVEPADLPSNVRALPMLEIYQKHRSAVEFSETDLTLDGYSLSDKEGQVLYIFDLAASAIGHNFDIIEIPDFFSLGALIPFALRHVGVGFERVVLSMHGTLSHALVDNWDENTDFDQPFWEAAEELLYRSADVRYGIGPGYIAEWQRLTGCPAMLMDLTSMIDMSQYRERRMSYGGAPKRRRAPTVAYVGRHEKCKGPDLFLELVADLPAGSYGQALIVGPSVTIGRVNSRDELEQMAKRRRLAIDYAELKRAELLNSFATKDWVIVLPSRKDTFNLAALEALLCGCPTLVSDRAGACEYLDRVLPGLPYAKMDPDNLPDARAQLLELIRDYDARRDELHRYLATAELSKIGTALPAIYQAEATPHRASQETLSQLFEPLAAYVEERVGEAAQTAARGNLRARLADMFRDQEGGSEQQLGALFDQVLRFREIAAAFAPETVDLASLADREFDKLTRELLPFCNSGNRVPVYRMLAELERKRGNELLYATYQIRTMRLSGTSEPKIISEVSDILKENGFPDEALVVGALYGRSPECAVALDYIRGMSRRFDKPPPDDFTVTVDHRNDDHPKISVIVSMYNVADKFQAFFRGVLSFTEAARRNMELILVDSNSADSTHDVVIAELDRVRAAGKGISTLYVRTAERETIQRAWNRGIGLSRGTYLAFLGVDEMNRPDALELMANFLDRHAAIDWVQGTAIVTQVNHRGGFVRDVMSYNRFSDCGSMQYLDTCYIGFVGALYRRSLHDRVGYYDDRFRAAGDTEFKNRALPRMRVATIPECLGFFWNYPDERTTHSPTAEIEDIRAWYLYRSLAGMMYAFDDTDGHDAAQLFFRCLQYRKSYMDIDCTDVELASTVVQYLAQRADFSSSDLAAYAPGVTAARDIYRVIDGLSDFTRKISGARAIYDLARLLESVGSGIATTNANFRAIYNLARLLGNFGSGIATPSTDFRFLSRTVEFDFTNDNRSHQHHWLWPSQAPHIRPDPIVAVDRSAELPMDASGRGIRAPGAPMPEVNSVARAESKSPILRPRRWILGKNRAAEQLIAAGDRARDARDWGAAALAYRQALDANPRLAAIWVQLGHALKEQGNQWEAETAYRRSLALDQGVADTHLQLGHVLKLQQREAEAASAYLSALLLDVDLAHARRELAALGYSRSQIAAAMTTGLLQRPAQASAQRL